MEGKIVQILKMGKYRAANDANRPYWIEVDVDGHQKCPLVQALTEREFFDIVNGILKPKMEACGYKHAQTIMIHDNQANGKVIE